jgi:hypothetical protein
MCCVIRSVVCGHHFALLSHRCSHPRALPAGPDDEGLGADAEAGAGEGGRRHGRCHLGAQCKNEDHHLHKCRKCQKDYHWLCVLAASEAATAMGEDSMGLCFQPCSGE